MSQDDAAARPWHELAELAAALAPEKRARVAELWTQAARYEHASIASFDRFALQLLALGAPPDLLQGAHRAALDEIEHARLSFRIASVYAGSPLGPGPLPIDPSALADFSLEKVLVETVEEGCIGETLAAAHAELLIEHVQGSVLQGAFTLIARDEATHAALAFQLVRWARGAFGEQARSATQRSFDSTVSKLRLIVSHGASDSELLPHGQMSDHDRQAASLRALTEVVEPAWRELLETR